MRYLIGGAALLLAGIAALALVLWLAVLDQARLEARVGEAVLAWTGQPLAATGGVELKLLPQPVVTVHAPRLGRLEDGFTLRADRLDLDVEALPLFTGALVVDVATLVRPELRLGADGWTALGALAERLAANGRQLPVRRLASTGGTLAAADGAVLWHDLDGWLQRDGEAGGSRFRLGGRLAGTLDARQLVLEGALGTAPPTRPLPLQVAAEVLAGSVAHRLAFRGQLRSEPPATILAGRVTLDLPGAAAGLAAVLPERSPSPLPDLPLQLQGDLALALGEEPLALDLAQTSLTLGGQALAGRLALRGGAAPSLEVRLDADRLDLDGFGGGAAAVARDLAGLVPPTLRGPVELRADRVDWRGETFRRVAVHLQLDGLGMAEIVRATAVLPGPGDLDFSGRLGPLAAAGPPRLVGRLEAAVQAPGELAALFIDPPALLRRSTTLSLATDLEWQPSGLTLRDADLRLDALQAVGGLAVREGSAGGAPQVALRASIDRLALADIVDPVSPGADLERLLQLAVTTDLAIDLRVSRTSLGDARFGGLTARLASSDGVVAIERLSLDDIAGSAAAISGRVHAPSRTFELSFAVDIASASRLVRLTGAEPPVGLALLGPLNLRGELAGDADRVEVTASLDADLFTGRGAASINGWRARPSAALGFSLEAAQAPTLLRQLGGVTLADPLVEGPLTAQIDLDIAEGRLRGAVLDVTLGDLDLVLDATRAAEGPGPFDRYALRLGPLSGDRAALLYRLATGPLDLVPGPPGTWLGYWPAQRSRWDWLQVQDLEAALTVVTADPAAPPIEIIGQLRDGALTVPAFRWAGEAGAIDGGIALVARDDGAGVEVTLDLALERFAAAAVMRPLGLPGDALSGTLDLEARLETHGRSLRDLVANLAGVVDLVLTEAVLGAPSPGSGGIAVERLEAALVVDRGVVRPGSATVGFSGPDGRGVIDGYADLLAWIVDLDLLLDGHDGAPLLRRRFFGPFAEPLPSTPLRDAVDGMPPEPWN